GAHQDERARMVRFQEHRLDYAVPVQLPYSCGFGLQVRGDIASVVRLDQEQHYNLLTDCLSSAITDSSLGCGSNHLLAVAGLATRPRGDGNVLLARHKC